MFSKYVRKSYENLGGLSQDKSLPGILSLYKAHFDKLYFVEVCEEYIQKVSKKDCSDQLFRWSLETISISIIEDSKKILAKFKGSGLAESSARELIRSHEVAKLGKKPKSAKNSPILLERAVDLTDEIFGYLFEKYQESIHRSLKEYKFWSATIVVAALMHFNFLYFEINYSINPSLKREVLETRGMQKLIPKEVLRRNKRIQNIILKGKNQLQFHKKRLKFNRKG